MENYFSKIQKVTFLRDRFKCWIILNRPLSSEILNTSSNNTKFTLISFYFNFTINIQSLLGNAFARVLRLLTYKIPFMYLNCLIYACTLNVKFKVHKAFKVITFLKIRICSHFYASFWFLHCIFTLYLQKKPSMDKFYSCLPLF